MFSINTKYVAAETMDVLRRIDAGQCTMDELADSAEIVKRLELGQSICAMTRLYDPTVRYVLTQRGRWIMNNLSVRPMVTA